MNKLKIFSVLAIILTAILLLPVLAMNNVSAYSHATFELSDNIVFIEDISGENRGFSLKRSTDVPRLTPQGYYDWSYRPDVVYPSSDRYRISDRLALEAFRVFGDDSQKQLDIVLERERNSFRHNSFFGRFGFRGHGYYGGYSSGYSRY